jgi:hypothetical protein
MADFLPWFFEGCDGFHSGAGNGRSATSVLPLSHKERAIVCCCRFRVDAAWIGVDSEVGTLPANQHGSLAAIHNQLLLGPAIFPAT